jgi:uncharacterized membrane protein YccC
MRLHPPKTWSREKLAIERRVAGETEAGSLTPEKRAMLLLAAKTALAAGICYWLATLVHLQDGYWGSISAIIVLQSNVGSTVTASRDRMLGTLIGAAYGAGFALALARVPVIWVYLLAVILAMVTCSLLGLKNSSRLAGVTVTIILLVHRPQPGEGPDWTLPMHRVLEVLLGIVVALVVSTLVLPSRARTRLREGLAQEFLLLGALFDAEMEIFLGRPSPKLTQIAKDAEGAVAANAVLLDAARNEPSRRPMSNESLVLLQQFGRELADVLKALGLAVQGSDGGGYAAQLEPELSRLSGDISKGFQYVAGCIHRWRFDVAPPGLLLQEDIAGLESRMAAIRPSGLEFPQAEILRAYAVQLHLKQLAQVLRRSRVETGAMVS